MTDHPIIFSAPMVRALLDGRKTMTRRLAWRDNDAPDEHGYTGTPSAWRKEQPGDRLWVREAFAEPNDQVIIYRANWREDALARGLDNVPLTDTGIRWHPSIHLPRKHSRLTLIVTAVKVERLQEISEMDARAEGIEQRDGCWGTWNPDGTIRCGGSPDARESFRCLWINLHGTGSWESNPEVVAVSFTVHKRNIDALREGISA